MTTTNLEVAETIRTQLGAACCALLGANTFMGDVDSLQFRIKGSPKKVNTIRIVLAANDTYTVEFWYVRGLTLKMVAKEEGVYVDNLHSLIELKTGLYTKF